MPANAAATRHNTQSNKSNFIEMQCKSNNFSLFYFQANISQHEYATKYREYLDLRYKREIHFKSEAKVAPPVLHSIRYQSKRLLRRKRTAGKPSPPSSLHVYFPLNITNHHDFQSMGIEEANVRLLLHFRKVRRKKNNPSKKEHKRLLIKIYQITEDKQRVLLDEKKITVDKFTKNQKSATVSHWMQFDVTKAVDDWLNGRVANKGLEIECDKCHRAGARIIDNIIFSDSSESSHSDSDLTPVLNIVSRMGETFREKRSRHHHTHQNDHLSSLRRTTDCSASEKRCCRHPMHVNFTEIRGYEFIIQPKYIDAGYCQGRCPPRYLPSNHHAILQSLIWKENKHKVPKLTCAPSKLSDLDVLHLDEHDDTKLKISTWTNMIVLDCACS